MLPLVFKTSVGPRRSWVGSIPIRLRHFCDVGFPMAVFNKITSLLLVVSGVACVVYGACFHSVNVSVDADSEMPITLNVAKSEPALTQDASVGGVALDPDTGEIKQTYTGESPKACAT